MEIRDDRCQPWAWFDHTIIDEYAIKIGPFGVSVYMAMVRYANNADQTCYPSYDTLQARLGLSRKTVANAINSLVHEGLIARVQRRSGPKGRMTNVYRILRASARATHRLVSDVNQPNVTDSLTNDSVSSPDTLTVSSSQKLTTVGQFTTETNVSSPGKLTVSFPHELEQDLVKAFNKTQEEQEKDPEEKSSSSPLPPTSHTDSSQVEETPRKRASKLPKSQQPGELHPNTIEAVQDMMVERFHCLAEPTKVNEVFWDAQIAYILEANAISFTACLKKVDAYWSSNPEKVAMQAPGLRKQMRRGIEIEVEKAQRAMKGTRRYG